MSVITDIPAPNARIIDYAIAHQGGAVARIRRVIRDADYLTSVQREALLGVIADALR
jgi:hypothetical protein